MTREVVAILQARMSSTRLPRKVLRPILGKPMLARQIERVRRASALDDLLVATSTDPADEPIEELCRSLGVGCYRGQLADVLARFHGAAEMTGSRHIVRLTADCPLADWHLIDRVVSAHEEGAFDYTSNVRPPSWPDGLDIEVVSAAALEHAFKEATDPIEREHVTPFIWRRPQRFRCHNLTNDVDLRFHRWTVDHPVDFSLVEAIYEDLHPRNAAFTSADVLALLARRQDLFEMNRSLARPAAVR
jgi:spore coat polysaccharide biosynthesis protein SpsF